MAIIDDSQYDAFFSYSHSDNSAFDNYIHHFYLELEKKLQSVMESKDGKFRGRRPKFFKDMESMPANGELSGELLNAIHDSHFLVVFLSASYLNSPWCVKEIVQFQKKFGTKRSSAYKHIFVLAMQEQAFNEYREKHTYGDEEPVIRILYDHEDRNKPVPAYKPVKGEDSVVISATFSKEVARVAETMADRILEIKPKAVPSAEVANKGVDQVIIGAVTDDLVKVRARLINKLDEAGINNTALEMDELFEIDEISGGSVFIQPLSFARVKFRGMDTGGHIEYQLNLLKRTDILKQVHWIPDEDDFGVIRQSDDDAEDDPKHLNYLENIQVRFGQTNLDDLIKSLKPHDSSPDKAPSGAIFIESNEENVQEKLISKLKEAWADISGDDDAMAMHYYSVNWNPDGGVLDIVKEEEIAGVVVVYTENKDERALFEQIRKIDDELHGASQHEPTCTVAVLPPHTRFSTTFWPSFYCNKHDGKLEIADDDWQRMCSFLVKLYDKRAPVAAGK